MFCKKLKTHWFVPFTNKTIFYNASGKRHTLMSSPLDSNGSLIIIIFEMNKGFLLGGITDFMKVSLPLWKVFERKENIIFKLIVMHGQ